MSSGLLQNHDHDDLLDRISGCDNDVLQYDIATNDLTVWAW